MPGTTDMSVTILGSGTCVPSLQRSSCAVLINIKGQALLFDSGVGTMRRLLEADTEIYDISFVFYSHFHPDHIAEFVPLIFANKYPDGTRRQMPITFVAGRGFVAFYNSLKKAYGQCIELEPGLYNIIELDNTRYDRRRFDDFTVESTPVMHNDESIAYRITNAEGKSVVYSGDTDFSENLVSLSKNADLLICESAFPDSLKVKGHLTPSLAGKIASNAQVKRLLLTHLYPECDDVDIERECRKTYTGPLIIAEDLIKIEL